MTKKEAMIEALEDFPVIASVKNEQGLKQCLVSEAKLVFVLYGSLASLPEVVAKLHEHHKFVLVHVDLIKGLASDDAAIDYLAHVVGADGILTTRSNLIQHANRQGLFTVHRSFVLDSMALEAIERMSHHPDAIEILPGIIHGKVLQELCRRSRVPVLAGGLIADKEDVIHALSCGCLAVSSTRANLWND